MTTPEAQEELGKIRYYRKRVPNEVYWALLDKINEQDENHQMQVVHKLSPTQVLAWYKHKLHYNKYIQPNAYHIMCEKIGKLHEDELLDELKYIQSHEIDNWLQEQKQQGYFFSKAVKDKIEAIKAKYEYNKNRPYKHGGKKL